MLNSNGHQMLQKKADSTYEPCVFRWDKVHSEPSSLLGISHPCAQVPPGATTTALICSFEVTALSKNLVLQPMSDRYQPALILCELLEQDKILVLR